jgi:hypothetical protein
MSATVRIVRAEVVSSADWARHPQRREQRKIDEQGRPILLRTIELP